MKTSHKKLESVKDVKTSAIDKEIVDAQKDIVRLEGEVATLSNSLKRSDYIKAEAKRSEIRTLKRFLNDARGILAARKA